MSAADQEHLRELASLHALGVLSPEERAELAAAVQADAGLAAEVRALEDTAGALGGAVAQIDPPARLRAKVLAVAGIESEAAGAPAVGSTSVRAFEAPSATARRSSGLPGWLAAAAALILASGLGLWALQLRTALGDMQARVGAAEREVVEMRRAVGEAREATRVLQAHNSVTFAPDTLRVDLAGQPVAPASHGRAFMSRHSGLAFAANRLPALPADKVYQLWVVAPNGPVSAGLLRPDQTGHAALFFAMPADLPAPVAIAVTIEPAGGVPAPTGDRVLLGEVASAG